MSYLLGAKVLRRLCEEQNTYGFYQAKLTPQLFKGDDEATVFKFVQEHADKFHVLPNISTLESACPSVATLATPEPSAYYVNELDTRFAHDLLSGVAKDVHTGLKADNKAVAPAEQKVRAVLARLTEHRYRAKILDLGLEGPEVVDNAYHGNAAGSGVPSAQFGWEYLDKSGGVGPGEVASLVGRPAMGKSYQLLWIGLHNWRKLNQNVMFVSMEMGNLHVAQRVAAMYAGTNITQLKNGAYSTITYTQYATNIAGMYKEPAKFYSVDANLAVNVESIYSLASILQCKNILIDGAYMVRSSNPRLGRYEKVAENVELMKRLSATEEAKTFASWQFAKTAVTKKKQKGAKEGLEDIGYADAIGQISSIVIANTQEEGVETMDKRKLSVIKGRDGQTGEFYVRWDFDRMDFSEVAEKQPEKELDFV